METNIAVFRGKEIRKTIHKNEWWFSIVDVIEALTGSERPRKYWSDLKNKLSEEGYAELSEKIGQLKLQATDEKFKGLKRENLRDHMTDLELIFSMLGEAATTEIARTDDARGFVENKKSARKGGEVAGKARTDLEQKTGKRVVTRENYLTISQGQKKLGKK